MVEQDETPDALVSQVPGGLPTALEAILIVAHEPQSEAQLAKVLDESEDHIHTALLALQTEYAGTLEMTEHGADVTRPRGFALREHHGTWQFVNSVATQDIVAAYIAGERTAKLSAAASEALAIVAYQQPITRAQVAAIRGVNSDGVIRSLMIRGLVSEEGLDEQTHAALLVTTDELLHRLGIASLDELPALAPFLPQPSEE